VSDFGTGDFTIECWAYRTGAGSGNRTLIQGPAFSLYWSSASQLILQITGSAVFIIASYAFPANQWIHFAVARSGTTIRMFINGAQVGSATNSASLYGASNQPTYVGATNGNGSFFPGYISNVRFVKGTALYTAAFTPPTTELTAISGTSFLTCQGNSIADNSTVARAITSTGSPRIGSLNPFGSASGWSGYFDGSGDYLTVPSDVAFDFGTGDFTIECWAYRTGAGTDDRFLVSRGNGGNFLLRWNAAGVLQFYLNATLINSYTYAFPINTWVHIAVARAGSTCRLFVNGVEVSSVANSAAVSSAAAPVLIGGIAASDYFQGYISNMRIVKGTAVYNAAFTPPSSALTAISGTSLLTLRDNTFKDNSSNSLTVTPSGNVAITAVGPFTATAVFPGSLTLQNLTFANTAALAALNVLGADFTIECWFNPSTFQNIHYILCSDYNTGTTSGNFQLYSQTSGVATFRTYGTNSTASAITLNSTRKIKLGAWNHIAITHTRSTNTTRLFLNGVLEASSTTATWAGATLATSIGILGQPGNQNYGAGASAGTLLFLVAGVRMIKGTALYTSAFTPPSSPPAATTDTVLLLNFNDGGIVDAYGSSATRNMVPSGSPAPSTSIIAKKFGAGSVAFSAGQIITGSSISGVTTSPSEFIFGTGDFTIECWINITADSSNQCIYDGRPFGGTSGAYVALFVTATSRTITLTVNGAVVITSKPIILNQWTHVALVRSSGVTRIYLDGIQSGSSWTDTTNYINATTGRPWIGGSSNANYVSGYLDDIRVYKGYGKYTSTFLPVEEANAIATPSSFSWVISGGAFANSITSASTSSLALGTDDFTIECWVYVNANVANYVWLVDVATASTGAVGFRFGNSGFGFKLQAYVNSSSASTIWSCATLQTAILGAWTHIAFTRQSGTCRLFVNGQVQNVNNGANPSTYPYTSFTDTTNVGAASLNVGGSLNGYITDARVIKGTALYTANFTPPTSKLTAVSGTVLLTAQNATAIDNSTSAITLTAGSNARATTTNYKY
jgi:hypothetical protein